MWSHYLASTVIGKCVIGLLIWINRENQVITIFNIVGKNASQTNSCFVTVGIKNKPEELVGTISNQLDIQLCIFLIERKRQEIPIRLKNK